MEKRKTAVIAIGGNSLILSKQHEDVPSQWNAVKETCKHIADMIERGWNLIITHGNGPQVGFILRRNELAAHEVHTTPLDLIGADTQGSIGYMIAQELGNEFRRRGIQRQIASVVTQVLVDKDDPGFQNPSKGIGGFTDEDDARKFEADGWQVVSPGSGHPVAGIVSANHPFLPAIEVQKRLRERSIEVGVRDGWVRFSPHFYTTAGELEALRVILTKL